MRLLICGSREYPGTWEDIAIHIPDDHDLTVIHGAYSRRTTKTSLDGRTVHNVEVSVDMLADFAARGLGHAVEAYPVRPDVDGPWPDAGPRRNRRMLAEGRPDRGLAFGPLWLSRRDHVTGTGDMVRRLLRAGLPVRWVPEPGAEAVDLTEMPSWPGPAPTQATKEGATR